MAQPETEQASQSGVAALLGALHIRPFPTERVFSSLLKVRNGHHKLVAEVLRHHQAALTAVHDTDAKPSELRAQNIGTMSWRIH